MLFSDFLLGLVVISDWLLGKIEISRWLLGVMDHSGNYGTMGC